MLTNHLRTLYKSKVVSNKTLGNYLDGWKIEKNILTKTFYFADFRRAMTFLTLTGDNAKQKYVKVAISNVYNRVTLKIEENSINELTHKEFEFALTADNISKETNPIETIVNYDYYSSRYAFPQNMSLDIANLIPTDPYSSKEKYLTEERNQQFLLN